MTIYEHNRNATIHQDTCAVRVEFHRQERQATSTLRPLTGRLALTLSLAVFAPLLIGCNAEPRHLDLLPSQSSPVHFAGYFPAPNATIEVHADPDIDSGSADDFELIATMVSDSTFTFADSDGKYWYPYEADITIPSQYWDRSTPPAFANLRLFGGPQKAPIAIFERDDATIQACMADNNYNGANIWLNCRSSVTGYAGDYLQDDITALSGFILTLRE